ncbi:HET-domain-containing protein [Hypoxylon sp. FL0543]|nr:HET-domain-containing protein [Hypoxylon sp. FL0543]
MYRWHRRTCRKPDISIVEDVVFCSSCDTTAEPPDLQLSHNSSLSTPKDGHLQSLNLQWPLSIQYLTEGSHDTNISQQTPGGVDTKKRQPDIRQLDQSYLRGDTTKASPSLDDSLYPPLAQKYDFRLLRLSALSSSGLLHGELDLVDLIYCPAFEALSYTWAGETGNNTKPRVIFVGPYWDIIPITVNCDSALRLLLSKGHTSLWIDSICINQQDPRERSHQVSIMREIYSKASQVLVYLGPAADHSDDAIEALNRLSQLRVYSEPSYQLSDTQRLALERLLQRRYFFRIWVIQEIAMSNGLTLYCGDKGISWRALSAMRIPYRYMRTVPWLLQYVQGGTSVMAQPEGLLRLLDATSNCAASDPRDNVFAVLGLLRDGIFEGLIPDYCLSTEQVYIGIASYLILRHNKTIILSYPKGRPGLLPSWVPDWSVYREPNIPSEDDEFVEQLTSAPFAGAHVEAQGHGVKKGMYFNPFRHEEHPDFRLYYSEDAPIDRNEPNDVIWLNSGQTSWTLFTCDDESLRIRYISKLLDAGDTGKSSNEQPGVDANTGALNIQSNIVTSFQSFLGASPYEFTRKVSFPGMGKDFEWLVKTEKPVDAEIDVIAYIPGCTSYLHMRRSSASHHYSLIGNCRIGFRQGTVRTIPGTVDTFKLGTSIIVAGSTVADIDIFDVAPHSRVLCASYGFDSTFLKFLDALLQSPLGKFIVSHLEGQGAQLGDLHTSKIDRYLHNELGNSGILEIYKTTSGWRASSRGATDVNEIKSACNMLTEQLRFWSRSTTWQAIDAIEACMKSIEDMERMCSDWDQIAKSLASIDRGSLSWKACDRPDTVSLADHKFSYTYAHGIEPETAVRLGLPAYSASVFSLVSALERSTRNLMQQLEFESELFDRSIPWVDLKQGEEPMSMAERVQVGRIYTDCMRSEMQDSERSARDPLIKLGSEAFYSKVQSRVAVLKWLSPSWQSYQGRLMEFRHACQHMSAIDSFQESIDQTRRIVVV